MPSGTPSTTLSQAAPTGKPLESATAASSAKPGEIEQGERIVTRIKCPGCGQIIPIYSRERPLRVECPACGKKGMLK